MKGIWKLQYELVVVSKLRASMCVIFLYHCAQYELLLENYCNSLLVY